VINDKIRAGLITRDAVYITTKLWSTSHRRGDVVLALKKSLANLSLEYVDLFLVHWPIALKSGEDTMPKDENGQPIYEDDQTDITDTWQGMIDCQEQGLCKSIGVSNFNINQLQRLIDFGKVVPANNQIEVNPFYANEKLVEFCQRHSILVSCYSPLGKPNRPWAKETDPFVSTDPTLISIGKKFNKTASQVALRFQLQRHLAVLPKSSSREHLKENLDIFDFELSDDDMAAIRNNCCSKNFKVLHLIELFGKSKEYPFNED
jgi:aldehyde reductase